MTSPTPSFLDPAAQIEELALPAPQRLLSGHPLQGAANTRSSPCNSFHAGIWESEPGLWAVHYTEFEYCEILEGESVLHSENGDRFPLRKGDRFVIPAGFRGRWEVLERCRKVYVIYEAP